MGNNTILLLLVIKSVLIMGEHFQLRDNVPLPKHFFRWNLPNHYKHAAQTVKMKDVTDSPPVNDLKTDLHHPRDVAYKPKNFLRWSLPNEDHHAALAVKKKGIQRRPLVNHVEKDLHNPRRMEYHMKATKMKTVLRRLFLQWKNIEETVRGISLQINGKEFHNLVWGISEKEMQERFETDEDSVETKVFDPFSSLKKLKNHMEMTWFYRII